MRGAWSEHTLSDWAYLNSSALGVFGAVAAVVTVVPAIIAVLNHRIKKQHKIEARERQNKRIQDLAHRPPEQRVQVQGWLKQIGRYGVTQDSNATELQLTSAEKKALYRGVHQGKTPKGAREDFLRFLALKFLANGALDDAEKNKGQAVKLKDLLGTEGFLLYKRAIKEEGKSVSFRRAVFEKALEDVDDSCDLKIEHEISQIQQRVRDCANLLGYEDIEDLQDHSQALIVKKYLKETVSSSERFHNFKMKYKKHSEDKEETKTGHECDDKSERNNRIY